MGKTLFDLGEQILIERGERTALAPNALVRRPVRNQIEIPVTTLDERVSSSHPVRAIASIVAALDLTMLEAPIDSNSVQGGRPAIDPHILLTLWIWGVSQGEFEASEIARRTRTDAVYQWICGGVDIGERSLSSFRAKKGNAIASLFSQVVGVLMSEGLIDLHRIAQDGMRVRAWSGADSFRRLATLETLLEEALAHYVEVMASANDPKRSLVARKAAERGAKDRVARIERAIARTKELVETRSAEVIADVKKAPRASTTDPEATRMKMADGGFRPAYNVQFATTADGQGAIVGVAVTNRGNDFGEIEPMIDRIEEHTGVRPKEALVDGGYVKNDDIEVVAKRGTMVYAPEPKKKADPASRTASERSKELKDFYARIESVEGKAIYAHRGEVAELANAHARSRFGLSTLLLRGLKGGLMMALLVAMTNNVHVLVRERARHGSAGNNASSQNSDPAPERRV